MSVGFVVAIIFALLSYFFYAAAVGVAAGILGYSLGVGLMDLFGLSGISLTTFVVATSLALAAVVVTFRFNLQKHVIIAATAISGAAAADDVILLRVSNVDLVRLAESPVRLSFQTSPFMGIVFVALAISGMPSRFGPTGVMRFKPTTASRKRCSKKVSLS